VKLKISSSTSTSESDYMDSYPQLCVPRSFLSNGYMPEAKATWAWKLSPTSTHFRGWVCVTRNLYCYFLHKFYGKEHSRGNSNFGKVLVKAFTLVSAPSKTRQNNSCVACKVTQFLYVKWKWNVLYSSEVCCVFQCFITPSIRLYIYIYIYIYI
jgi:hypothetical protein